MKASHRDGRLKPRGAITFSGSQRHPVLCSAGGLIVRCGLCEGKAARVRTGMVAMEKDRLVSQTIKNPFPGAAEPRSNAEGSKRKSKSTSRRSEQLTRNSPIEANSSCPKICYHRTLVESCGLAPLVHEAGEPMFPTARS